MLQNSNLIFLVSLHVSLIELNMSLTVKIFFIDEKELLFFFYICNHRGAFK